MGVSVELMFETGVLGVRFGMRSRPERTYDEYFMDRIMEVVKLMPQPHQHSSLELVLIHYILQVALDLENNALYFGKI